MKLVISIVNKVHVWKTWHVGMIQGWLKVDFVWCDANLRLVILTTLPINLSKTKQINDSLFLRLCFLVLYQTVL